LAEAADVKARAAATPRARASTDPATPAEGSSKGALVRFLLPSAAVDLVSVSIVSIRSLDTIPERGELSRAGAA